jgi:hypothetical protein
MVASTDYTVFPILYVNGVYQYNATWTALTRTLCDLPEASDVPECALEVLFCSLSVCFVSLSLLGIVLPADVYIYIYTCIHVAWQALFIYSLILSLIFF